MSHMRHGVSKHRQHNCLFCSLLNRLAAMKTLKHYITGLLWGEFTGNPWQRDREGFAKRLLHVMTQSWLHINPVLNPSPPSAAYKRQWIGSALVQIMACRLFGAKPLYKPMLICCRLDPYEQTSRQDHDQVAKCGAKMVKNEVDNWELKMNSTKQSTSWP